MITSENAVFGTEFKTFFVCRALFFRYLIFYILKNYANFKSCDIIIFVWTVGERHFSLSFESFMKLGQLIDIAMENILRKYLA